MTNQDVIKDHQLTINAFGMHSLGSFRYYWQHLLWKIDFFQSMFRKPIKTKFALHGLFFRKQWTMHLKAVFSSLVLPSGVPDGIVLQCEVLNWFNLAVSHLSLILESYKWHRKCMSWQQSHGMFTSRVQEVFRRYSDNIPNHSFLHFRNFRSIPSQFLIAFGDV